MRIHPGFVGIDVSKHSLDIFDGLTGRGLRIANNPAAIAAWAVLLAGREVLVTFEATGRYDSALQAALTAAGIAFARVNPARARDFARASGHLAKTDAIDARMLAAMGQCLALEPGPARDETRQRLARLHGRRDQLVANRAQEKARLAEALPDERDGIERHIAWLADEIRAVEAARDSLIREDETLARLSTLLRSIPGIGPVAAASLLALMPELGTLTPKAAAALVGLAPFNRDSGRVHGKRQVRGGRKRLRDALYMAAIAAARSQSRLATFAAGLKARNKPFKVIMIGLARKILVTANAVLRDQVAFHP